MTDPDGRPIAPDVSEKDRFIMELEFVQSLGNPHYLHHLAQNKYFDDPAFFNYLKYLEYWKKEPYVTYIRFPQCLLMLDLLHHEQFRQTVTNFQLKEELLIKQHSYYTHYRANRIKEAAAGASTSDMQQQQQQQQGQQSLDAAGKVS